MSDFIPKSNKGKIGGLGPAAQRLQAARDKAAAKMNKDGKQLAGAAASSIKAKDSFANTKKTTFQRKAV